MSGSSTVTSRRGHGRIGNQDTPRPRSIPGAGAWARWAALVLGWHNLTEPKRAKNRCHVDLTSESREALAEEVDRLSALGGTVLRDPKEEFGHYWAPCRTPKATSSAS
ncbi:MAG: VOC family protein [Acidimicrobiales bacterium]